MLFTRIRTDRIRLHSVLLPFYILTVFLISITTWQAEKTSTKLFSNQEDDENKTIRKSNLFGNYKKQNGVFAEEESSQIA